MSGPLQSILVPVLHSLPESLLSFAELLSSAYNKPISLLFFDEKLYQSENTSKYYSQYRALPLSDGLRAVIEEQDSVMVLLCNDRKYGGLQRALTACRELRIPYFFIPLHPIAFTIKKVLIPVTFLIEEREKGIWARSLSRVFKATFTFMKPRDKGSRAGKNVTHISDFLTKNEVKHRVVSGRKSSFNINLEACRLAAYGFDLLMITASREYGLDDLLFGPKERRVIAKSTIPVMVLNPRDDLYILCGD